MKNSMKMSLQNQFFFLQENQIENFVRNSKISIS